MIYIMLYKKKKNVLIVYEKFEVYIHYIQLEKKTCIYYIQVKKKEDKSS